MINWLTVLRYRINNNNNNSFVNAPFPRQCIAFKKKNVGVCFCLHKHMHTLWVHANTAHLIAETQSCRSNANENGQMYQFTSSAKRYMLSWSREKTTAVHFLHRMRTLRISEIFPGHPHSKHTIEHMHFMWSLKYIYLSTIFSFLSHAFIKIDSIQHFAIIIKHFIGNWNH